MVVYILPPRHGLPRFSVVVDTNLVCVCVARRATSDNTVNGHTTALILSSLLSPGLPVVCSGQHTHTAVLTSSVCTCVSTSFTQASMTAFRCFRVARITRILSAVVIPGLESALVVSASGSKGFDSSNDHLGGRGDTGAVSEFRLPLPLEGRRVLGDLSSGSASSLGTKAGGAWARTSAAAMAASTALQITCAAQGGRTHAFVKAVIMQGLQAAPLRSRHGPCAWSSC